MLGGKKGYAADVLFLSYTFSLFAVYLTFTVSLPVATAKEQVGSKEKEKDMVRAVALQHTPDTLPERLVLVDISGPEKEAMFYINLTSCPRYWCCRAVLRRAASYHT